MKSAIPRQSANGESGDGRIHSIVGDNGDKIIARTADRLWLHSGTEYLDFWKMRFLKPFGNEDVLGPEEARRNFFQAHLPIGPANRRQTCQVMKWL